MFAYCNALDNFSLANIANALLIATNISKYRKNLMNSNLYSPLKNCNKQINAATVGTDLIAQLHAAG
jgi:hypothetical protein